MKIPMIPHLKGGCKPKTARQWIANHERMEDPPDCEYGHVGCSCSARAKGPCLDEMLAMIAEEEATARAEGSN